MLVLMSSLSLETEPHLVVIIMNSMAYDVQHGVEG